MGKEQKYFLTPEIEALLRDRYDPAIPGRCQQIATQLGWPKWGVGKLARWLGLGRIKERRWTTAETDYLASHYHRIKLKTMARKLKRTVVAVHLKAKRLGYRKAFNGEGYTARGLAIALGVDEHFVTARIRAGKIRSRWRQTERHGTQGGDVYYISERAVIHFIAAHPMDIDLRKVDQLWFIELIADALDGLITGVRIPKGKTGQPGEEAIS